MKKQLSQEQHIELAKLGYKGGPRIADLIEFLDEHSGEDIADYNEHAVNIHDVGKPWHHWFTIHWDQEYKELCDALFEAVKEVLNDN